jgi:hypothetical protein
VCEGVKLKKEWFVDSNLIGEKMEVMTTGPSINVVTVLGGWGIKDFVITIVTPY